MIPTTIRKELSAQAEEKYRLFTVKLLPGVGGVLGVRLPALRKMARQIAGDDWRAWLAVEPECFEEIMLQGLVIGYVCADIEETLRLAAEFVPKIDNWSVCDSFCIGLKITREHKERVWEFLQPYRHAEQEFAVRFYAVMLLTHYIDEEYVDRVLEMLDGIRHEGYYVKMAVAWAVSICFVKHRELTFDYLRRSTLDTFTYNKSLQKIAESLVVDGATKKVIREMKRGGRKASGKA